MITRFPKLSGPRYLTEHSAGCIVGIRRGVAVASQNIGAANAAPAAQAPTRLNMYIHVNNIIINIKMFIFLYLLSYTCGVLLILECLVLCFDTHMSFISKTKTFRYL